MATDRRADRAVNELLPQLRSPAVVYFPIRHHSPACARLLRQWIEANRPASVLVEGPRSCTRYIDALVDPRCESPVAIYSHFIDRRELTNPSVRSKDSLAAEPSQPPAEPARFAAFYPFCDYSPELVALRAGHAVGANLQFIDLEFAAKVLAETPLGDKQPPSGVRIESLAADSHLRHSRYMAELARRFGCRDFDELWDHLFESGSTPNVDALIDRLAAYCAIARLDYDVDDLARDGTTAREACMAHLIRREVAAKRKTGRPVLVVTGGFHTVALPGLVASDGESPPRVEDFPADEVGEWLVPYSFEQLDALAGYAAGMPNPGFYDRLWRASERVEENGDEIASACGKEAVAILVDVARQAREQNSFTPLSTPDIIAAARSARQLAALRGHLWPQREDLLDGVRSCFVKGEMATDGFAVMKLVHQVLAGNRVGKTPPQAELPAIVDDFRREASRLRIALDSIEQRPRTLDLYKKPRHRELSRFFHRLDLLGAPFASFDGGPDFVQGTGLELMQEHWRLRWSPGVEAALIEVSIYGPTIESAAAAKLDEAISLAEQHGRGRSAEYAVELLIRACRLGLHQRLGRITRALEACLHEDHSFRSVVVAMSQLDLLRSAREPLGAHHLNQLPALVGTCYVRAIALLGDLGACPDEGVASAVDAMRALRECVSANAQRGEEERLDSDILFDALQRVITGSDNSQPAIVGAAAGLLYLEGHLDVEALMRLVSGHLASTDSDPRRRCGVVRGLLATAREIAWQTNEMLVALDDQFSRWEEREFTSALPELRLAFADLAPLEIARVAERVAAHHGGVDLGELVLTDVSEAEAMFAAEITRLVREQLADDELATAGGNDNGR